jgi:LacI family transcriptional regulator
MMITVKEVAREARVSLGTVSRVLNGEPSVAPEVSRRVHRAVRTLGYEPLRRRGPRAGIHPLKSKRIALVLLGMDRSLVNLPVVAAAIHGAESALAQAGATPLLVDLPKLDTLPEVLASRRLDGVILKSALQDDVIGRAAPDLVARLRELPSVWVTGRPARGWGDVIQSNDQTVGRLAAEHLLARGHRRIAFFNPKPDHITFRQREASFLWHARQGGARVRSILGDARKWELPLQIVESTSVLQGMLDRVLRGANRPTALFVPADSIGAMLYRALGERGLPVGRSLSVISCNNEQPLLIGLHPSLTTIDIHAHDIGRRAVEQLAARIADPKAPSVEIGIEPSLVEGASVADLERPQKE